MRRQGEEKEGKGRGGEGEVAPPLSQILGSVPAVV